MLIDGNDDRGIDIGLLARDVSQIQSIVSHVDDTDAAGLIYSRDCAEYQNREKKQSPAGGRVRHGQGAF